MPLLFMEYVRSGNSAAAVMMIGICVGSEFGVSESPHVYYSGFLNCGTSLLGGKLSRKLKAEKL